MSTSESSFEYILQALRVQKQYLEQLQAENSDLRHQLADLRNGQGMFVEILGARFALVGTQPSGVMTNETTQETPTLQLILAQTVDAPTTAMPFVPETPRPVEPFDEHMPQLEHITDEITPTFSAPSLLEDDMYEDDFADSVTSPVAVWKGTEAKSRQKSINEDEK